MKKLIVLLLALATVLSSQAQSSALFNPPPQSVTSFSVSAPNGDLLPATDLTVNGYTVMAVTIGGTWVGTVSFQGSTDGFATPISIAAYQPNSPGTFVTTATSNGTYIFSTLGFHSVRIRMTSYVSGTATSFVVAYNKMIPIPSASGSGGGGGGLTDAQLRASAVPVTLPVGQTTMAASIPVVIASNQGNIGTNTAQINGVTPLMGNGVSGTGSQRVNIASDNTAFAVNNTQQGTASQNVAQVNGVTTSTGNGVTGAGSQRVTIASDNSAIPTNSTLQTGANVVGKVGIDQTTPGTTNGVQVNAALPTGTNYIGYTNGDLSNSTANLSSPGNGSTFSISGMRYASVNVTGSAVSFVFKVQVSTDAGTTWTDSYLLGVNGVNSSTATINGQYGIFIAAGVSSVRVVLNSIVSGTFTYQYRATNSGNDAFLNMTATGFGVPPATMMVGGSDGSNLQALATTVKGTQGGNGLSVQQLHDAGRVEHRYYATGVASGTTGTETAITLTKSTDNNATSSAVSFTITNGKRFRITSITVSSRGNSTATPQISTFSIRINTAGAVTTASTPIILSLRSATINASEYDRMQLTLPEGMEILGNGTIQWGITANSVFVTNAPTWDVLIVGYEY